MKYSRQLKRACLVAWLLVPVALISYHFGPGQAALSWREAANLRDQARAAESTDNWERASALYSEASAAVPAHDATAAQLARDQLRLAQIRAAFQLGKLDDTLTDLRQFIAHIDAEHGAESELSFDARDLLGRVHYQAMIALRLESAEEQAWMRQWELSRQNFRFLAEHSSSSRNALDRKNLEVVIKSANLPTPPPPPAGGGGGGGPTASLIPPPPTQTPPVTDGGAAPADNRPRAPTLKSAETLPPEFERGS